MGLKTLVPPSSFDTSRTFFFPSENFFTVFEKISRENEVCSGSIESIDSNSPALDLEEDKEENKYSPLVGIRGRAELAQHAVQIGRQGIKQLKEKQKGLG